MKVLDPGMSTLEGAASARVSMSTAELMSDSAIYRRTSRGQRALLRSEDPTASPGLRLLARLNGYTDLRRLIDLAPGDARDLPRAIQGLFDDGLIELVEPESGAEAGRASRR